jgi:hypothetical protein
VQAPEFTTAYDILNENYLSLSWFPVIWLGIIIFVATMFILELRKKKFHVSSAKSIIMLILLPLFLILGVFELTTSISKQYHCMNSARNGDFTVIEGRISGLNTRSKRESFMVNGLKFEHSEHDYRTCGYKQAKGIILKGNMLVRLASKDGCILKMEVATE